MRDALERLELFPIVMEHFGAQPNDATTVSTQKVAECDVYVLVVAWRYGYVPDVPDDHPDGERLYVTEREYREARRLEKPCFVFLADASTEANLTLFPAATRDDKHYTQLDAFRRALETAFVMDYFTDPDNLALKVVLALVTHLPRVPAAPDRPFDLDVLPVPPTSSVATLTSPGCCNACAKARPPASRVSRRLGVWAASPRPPSPPPPFACSTARTASRMASPSSAAKTSVTLGHVAQARGQLEEADAYFQQSLTIDREVQDRQGEGVDLAQLGVIAEAQERWEDAERAYRDGLAVLLDVQDALNYAHAAVALAELLIEHRDNRTEGCALLQQAVQLFHEMGVSEVQHARERAQELGCPVPDA